MVQLSHPYMTTGKTITLTIQTFVNRVMSLLFNTLSGFVIAFLPRSKGVCLFVCFHFVVAGTICSDSGPQKNKVYHCFHYFPTYLPWSEQTGSHQFSSLQLSFVRLFATPWTAAQQAYLPLHHQLPELVQTHAHWVSDAIQPSRPLPSPSLLPPIFPNIRVFSNESVLCIR